MHDDQVRLVFAKNKSIEVVQFWRAVDWGKQPPGMLQDPCPGSLRPISIETGWQTSQPRQLDKFRDVHLIWSNFLINGDCCTSIYDDARTAVSGIVDWADLSKTAGVWRNGDDFVVSTSRLQSAECIGGKIMLASSNEPHNWGMFLLYVLPAVQHFIEHRHEYDKLLAFIGRPNMRAMLHLLGLTDDDIIIHDCSRAYHFESIDVFRQPQRDFYVAQEAKALFAELRDEATRSVVVPNANNIYVGRRRWTAEMNGYRALENESDLIERLAKIGYSEINPECLPPEQQIALFGSARRVVALGGAGLFNAVFCKLGTKIVDIESNRDHLDNHSTMLSSIGVDYGIIVGAIDQSDPASYNKKWTVDVERAVAAIASFMD